MGHTLKKYLSNRGSALFMVISTMTALFISCMAMYFSMFSAREAQNVVFNKLQANQSAMSIARIVANGISVHSESPDSLYYQVMHMADGDSITTDANGFKSLDPNVATGLDLPNLGAYSVTITRTGSDASGKVTFDVMVITSVDGNRDSVHMTGSISETVPDTPDGEDGSGGDSELFSATGYVPNDAYINGGWYLTDCFYDTQYTYMSYFGGSGVNRIGQDLYTGGSLMIGGNSFTVLDEKDKNEAITSAGANAIGPVTWAIRGDFYYNNNVPLGARGGTQILIGGDFVVGSQFTFQKNNDSYTGTATLDDHINIYVNGDFNFSYQQLQSNTWLFVNGNVTGISGAPLTNVKIFVTGTEAERAAKTAGLDSNYFTNGLVNEWPITGAFADGLNYTEAMQLLGQKTQTISYYKWDLSANTNKSSTQNINITINATNSEKQDKNYNTIDPYQGTYVIAYPGSKSESLIKGHGGNELGVVGDSFIIDGVQVYTDNNTMSETILIDTGDDPTNIMTIKLSDVTGNGEFAWFVKQETWHTETVEEIVTSWWPYESYFVTHVDEYIGEPEILNSMLNSNYSRSVMVRGRGIVLIDVPEGVTYTETGYSQTLHAGWWLIEGGYAEMRTLNGVEHIWFDGVKSNGSYSKAVVDYIHRVCEDGDGCAPYDLTKVSTTSKCVECGNALTIVHCNIHGDVNKFCATCYPEKINRDDWCKNHVDNQKFTTFYNTLSGVSKDLVTGKDNDIVYPNTNIMLVSCSESADMRFSLRKDGASVMNNSFFGFIYAPYISYLAASSGEMGGTLKLFGGLTVGDYDINSMYSFVGCYPDKMPAEIAGMAGGGSMAGGKLTGTSKTWKVEIGGYK